MEHIGKQIAESLYLAANPRKAPEGYVRFIKLTTKRATGRPTAASLWARYEAWDTLPNVVPPEGYVCAFTTREDFARHMPDWRILRFSRSRVFRLVRWVVIEAAIEDVIYADQQVLVRNSRVVFATL